MKVLISVILTALALSGCVTVKDWSATGGSRADGVVRLSYDFGGFQKPQLNEIQAISLATQRCKSWGYTSAEAFGGITKQCSQSNGYGCTQWIVTKEYQCIGSN